MPVLASNIIEVEVDIDRLSLLGVVGRRRQPRRTSRSQDGWTSLVGATGLILMLYSPSKSRDRSHFETVSQLSPKVCMRGRANLRNAILQFRHIQRALPGALLTWGQAAVL